MKSGASSSQDDDFLRAVSCESRRGHNSGRHSQDQDKKVSSATDGEIGVFAAEKYFSGEVDSTTSTVTIPPTIHGLSRDLGICSDPTASVASESSWYSRSALLHQDTALRKHDSSTRTSGKNKSKSFLSSLGIKCKCSCLDGNSSDVDENARETRPPGRFSGLPHRSISSSADEFFSFSTMNPLPRTLIRKEEAEIPRESLEVFGSPVLQKRNTSSINPRTGQESDSDQSSELFEIGSLTGEAKEKTFLATQGTYVVESPPHPPSEASVEWSVVTASAAEFPVAPSDYSEEIYKNILMSKAKLEPKQSSSVLSCCVDRKKSSGVAGDSYRIVSPRLDRDLIWRNCSYSSEHKERLRAEPEMNVSESRKGMITASPRFFSPHASHRMNIQ
ncbi:PREDICTED: protein PHYTOCHROME KINASE SUBSTRATE 1-like [Tarenaya hassleriana]|uniref:protein PHYTOCHROME KINASE SUBSTRATE 1-like n=1 Tax=Tarenaya hassleriana TaxID=28532 RepID=UPI00053C9B59|nr:PREDICTED: protein PHYTOCHROME KINASE SUBSTRATE 1-like [Tarenaya hassleriana]